AAKAGYNRVLQECTNTGVDPNSRMLGQTALEYISFTSNTELVQILLDAGADINAPPVDQRGRTALQAAAGNGNIELVRILLDAGAGINAPPADQEGRTALQATAGNGDVELV
ncbi:ankyrin, partial [Lojkania enalia]